MVQRRAHTDIHDGHLRMPQMAMYTDILQIYLGIHRAYYMQDNEVIGLLGQLGEN